MRSVKLSDIHFSSRSLWRKAALVFLIPGIFYTSPAFCGELPEDLGPKRFQLTQKTAPQQKQEIAGDKQALKAFLLSAMVPGLGQMINKDHYRALGFFAVEIMSIFYYRDQDNKGKDLETIYQNFADAHWVEDRYWDALAAASGEKRTDIEALKQYEAGRWSHHLPDWRNQTYYENIGKYDQFNSGWDDAQSDFGRDSKLRDEYTFMRKDSNDAFNRAGMAISIIMVNHIISAFEAGFTAHRQKNSLHASMKIVPKKTATNQYVPALAMRFSW